MHNIHFPYIDDKWVINNNIDIVLFFASYGKVTFIYHFLHTLSNTPMYFCTHFHCVKAQVILHNQYVNFAGKSLYFVGKVFKHDILLKNTEERDYKSAIVNFR